MDPVSRLLEGLMPELVISYEGTSQYTQGGTSTCGLAALNAVRLILGLEQKGTSGVELIRQIACKSMMDEIVAICARWSSQLHLEVDDIASLPLFNTLALSFSEYDRAESQNFTGLLRRLEEASQAHGGPSPRPVCSAVVITRPPEILSVFHVPTHSPGRHSIFIIFDSHPRPTRGTKGASLILFPTLEATSLYISNLLNVDKGLLAGLGSMQWQAQLLGHYSGHVFLARNHCNVDTDATRVYDANMDVLELRYRLKDADEKIRSLYSDNSRLHERMAQLELTTLKLPSPISHGSPIRGSYSSRTGGTTGRSVSPAKAGPSTKCGINMESKQPPHMTSVEIRRRSSHSRERERVDASFAARLHREQDKELASLELARRTQGELDKEDFELQSQMRWLQKMAQELFECSVCLEKHAMDSVARVDACRHELCRGCMKNFVASKLEEHRYPIVCPICQLDSTTKDPGVIAGSLIEQLGLTEKQHAVWIELELSEFSLVLDCPSCQRSTFVDRCDHTEMKLLQCPLPDCNHVWCKSCQRTVEAGTRHSCDGTLELDDLMKTQGWRYCPGCNTPAEKYSGCNHMTCIARGCNTHFCYQCGESIVQSARRSEIQASLKAHYRRCHLFQDVPDRMA